MKLALVGSSNFNDYQSFTDFVEQTLVEWGVELQDIEYVISGGARGADSLAEKWVDEHNFEKKIYPAEWNKYGKRAGLMRNSLIVDDCTHIIAFPSSNGSGTQDRISKAIKAKKFINANA